MQTVFFRLVDKKEGQRKSSEAAELVRPQAVLKGAWIGEELGQTLLLAHHGGIALRGLGETEESCASSAFPLSLFTSSTVDTLAMERSGARITDLIDDVVVIRSPETSFKRQVQCSESQLTRQTHFRSKPTVQLADPNTQKLAYGMPANVRGTNKLTVSSLCRRNLRWPMHLRISPSDMKLFYSTYNVPASTVDIVTKGYQGRNFRTRGLHGDNVLKSEITDMLKQSLTEKDAKIGDLEKRVIDGKRWLQEEWEELNDKVQKDVRQISEGLQEDISGKALHGFVKALIQVFGDAIVLAELPNISSLPADLVNHLSDLLLVESMGGEVLHDVLVLKV
ncbi:hypothetical protein QOT17_010426 [Balamuthia mandrillaris]